MDKLKMILAVFLMTAIFNGFGAEDIQAKSSDLVVVLDAGHGGYDFGASGSGLYEKILNLKIAQYCKSELEKYKGVKVYMTRSKDTYVGLDERVSIASGVKADVFVSIHINSAVTASATGAEVYYPNLNYRPSVGAKGRKLAGEIQKKLVALGLYNRGIKIRTFSGGTVYADNSAADYYAVIRGSKKAGFPGVIVEHAFISNPADVRSYLSSNVSLKALGVADAKGIAACYGLKKTGDTAETLTKTKLTKLTGQSSTSVSLGWSKVKGADGYEIYRSASKNGTFTKIATVKKAATVSYKDKSLAGGRTFYYKVRPYKMVSDKKIVAGFCAAQKVKLLKKPSIAVKNQSSTRTKVSWKAVPGALQYEVYRSTSEDGKYQKIASVQDVTSFKDTNRRANKSYYYKVRAVSKGVKGNNYSSYSVAQ